MDRKLLEKLKSLGIHPQGQPTWVDLPETPLEDIPSIQKHRELLVHIREALKEQLDRDLEQLESLRLEQERRKNGGGT